MKRLMKDWPDKTGWMPLRIIEAAKSGASSEVALAIVSPPVNA